MTAHSPSLEAVTVSVSDHSARRVVSAPLFDGVYQLTLNELLDVVFCPDVSTAAPPWTRIGWPATVDDVSTALEARMLSVFSASYAVTPNQAHSGEHDTFVVPADGAGRSHEGRVHYLDPADFDACHADLATYHRQPGASYPGRPLGELGDRPFARLLVDRVLALPYVDPAHLRLLGL